MAGKSLSFRFLSAAVVRYARFAAFSFVAGIQVPMAMSVEGPPTSRAGARVAAEAGTIEGVQGLIRAGRYAEAEREGRALLRVNEQVYGVESMPVAEVLDTIAEAMRNGGRTRAPDALEICERAVRIKARLAGKASAPYAASLHNLGALYMMNGDFGAARSLLEEAYEIRKRTLGENDPEVARSLLFLANLDFKLARELDALPLVERALAIQKVTLAEDDPERMRALNMLAGIRFGLGDFTSPANLWQEVLANRRKALGADHPLVAETLHNLGALATETGDYDEALGYLDQALQIRRSRLGRNHPLVASTLVVMASTLRSLGDPAAAQSCYEEALRIQDSSANRNDADLAWTLRWFGHLLIEEGNYARAKSVLARAKSIQERELGSENQDLAGTLDDLALVAEKEGHRREAKMAYERSIAIRKAEYGESYPDVVATLGRYSRFLVSIGDSAKAFDTALPAALARVEHLRSTTRGLSERQALAYAAVGSPSLDVLLALAAAHPTPDRVRAAWDALIRTRTVVLDEIAARHHTALDGSRDSTIAAPRRELELAARRYANLLVRGVGVEDRERYRAAIERAREDVESADRELAARSGARGEISRREDVGWSRVATALPNGWGMLAFARYGSGNEGAYVAFLARADRPPFAISIGSAREVDGLVLRFATLLARGDRGAKGALDPKAEVACRAAGAALRRRVWDPIQERLQGIPRLFVVPDGSLHLLNFAALPTREDTYLVEIGPLIHYLSAERDLVRVPERHAESGLLALGGASFDSREEREAPGGHDAPESSMSSGGTGQERRSLRSTLGRGPQPDCREFREARFLPLPESAAEVAEIDSIWGDPKGTLTLTGPRAGETAIKELAPGRRVLHLATHGFFLDASHCASEGKGTRGIGGVSAVSSSQRRPGRRASPLLISGLALAGANLRLRAKPDQEDGILMAQEIVSMDLSSAEWVVLSACDTGLGKVQAGEGVLGLRRAFEAAGAGTVIMSLWEVEDRSTREWMRNLYEARFHRHRDTPEAVRDAALGVYQDRKAHGLGTHPFYWAAFVAAGDWR